jgi:hypothetical protein
MTRHLITLVVALGLCTFGSAAFAGKPCPWNDKKQPEKSKVCMYGTLHVCEDGQWVSLGTKCTPKFQEDAHAALSLTRRVLGEASPRRDAIVARIAPQS